MNPLRPARIMVANDALSVGGAERVAVDIANSLDRDRYEVSFCSTRVGGPLEAELEDDIDVTILGRGARWDIGKLVTFGRLVDERQIDIIHTHGRGTLKFVALAKALGLVRARHVFHDHFGWLHLDRGASWGLRTAMLRSVDEYIGVDARLCAWANEVVGLPAERVHLVRSGIDVGRFSGVEPHDLRAELQLPADSFVLVMVANFRPQKDHPTLFRAIAELPPELLQPLQLVICGSTSADQTYHNRCAEMVAQLGLTEHIRFVGARDDTAAILAGADAAVLSSKNETGPLVVLEYMASSLPFVATDTGEITHSIRDLDVGLVPAPRDHHDLADALARLLRMSAAERVAMGARGRAVIEKQFDQRTVVRRIEDLYSDVLFVGGRPSESRPFSRSPRSHSSSVASRWRD